MANVAGLYDCDKGTFRKLSENRSHERYAIRALQLDIAEHNLVAVPLKHGNYIARV